ncbi:MAG: permease, partial [Schleiferiaceae bacterium]
MQEIIHEFLTMLIDVMPYFIVAVLFSAFLEAKLNSEKLLAPFIKGRFAIIWASILGGILPGCACATVPLAENLRQKEAGLGVTSAFLLVSPLLGPHTIILTYGFLGAKFAVGRVVAAMIGAIVLGYGLHWFEKRNLITMPKFKKKSCCSVSGCSDESCEHPTFLQAFWRTTKLLGGYFLLGI